MLSIIIYATFIQAGRAAWTLVEIGVGFTVWLYMIARLILRQPALKTETTGMLMYVNHYKFIVEE